MAVRRFDPPKPKPIQFNGRDREKMIRVQREVADLLLRMMRAEEIEAGVIAFALSNLSREFLERYPANFRKKLVDTVITHIFNDAANVTQSDNRIISLN